MLSHTDQLILTMCKKTKEECIVDAQNKLTYLDSKINYLKQFLPDYHPNLG